jgi:hypothetical protein
MWNKMAFVNEPFMLGKEIYVPQKDFALAANIVSYDAKILKAEEGLTGLVTAYTIDRFASLRAGSEVYISDTVPSEVIYVDKSKAVEMSRFLPVRYDKDDIFAFQGSEDLIEIFQYCLRNKGLNIHDRNELEQTLETETMEISPLDTGTAKVLSQLSISCFSFRR